MFEDSAYCVIRRGAVRIAWTPLALHDGQEVLPDSPVPICLALGEECRTRRCPTFQVPPGVMASWVARAGLGHGRLPERRDRCRLCGDAADLQVIDAGTVYCPRCGGIDASPDAAGGREGAPS